MTFVAAKPDFGVDVMIRGSVAVQGTAVMIEERLSELTKHMSFSLVSSYGLLSDLRTQMDLLARKVATIGTTFATALNQASTSNSNVTATFHPVLLSLARLQTLQVDELPPILAEIEKLVKLSIKLELQDSFKTLQSSVQLMVGAVVQLTAAVVDNPYEARDRSVCASSVLSGAIVGRWLTLHWKLIQEWTAALGNYFAAAPK